MKRVSFLAGWSIALLMPPVLLPAAPDKLWEPVNASLSQLLYEFRYWIGELMSSPSFQVLLVGVALICAVIWGMYGYEAGQAQKEKRSVADRAAWRSPRGRRHVIRHYFGLRRRATL